MLKKLALAGLLVLACTLPALAHFNTEGQTDVSWVIADDYWTGNQTAAWSYSRGRTYLTECEHFYSYDPKHLEGDSTEIFAKVVHEDWGNITQMQLRAIYEYNTFSGSPWAPTINNAVTPYTAVYQDIDDPDEGDEFYVYSENIPAPEHSGWMRLRNQLDITAGASSGTRSDSGYLFGGIGG